MTKGEVDILNRKDFINTIMGEILACSKLRKAASIAIDGEWGSGKSFVLDLLKERILDISENNDANNHFVVFRYNSWEYDYYEEPIVAIVAAMQDELVKEKCRIDRGKRIGKDSLETVIDCGKNIAKQVLQNKLELDFQEIKNEIPLLEDIDDMSLLRSAISSVRSSVSAITQYATVIILIDELDRCMPEYAIKVLNRCNHLFGGIDNLQLIYAINGGQLDCSIKKIFGDEVNTDIYLRKFIDRWFTLNNGVLDSKIIEHYRGYWNSFNLINDEGLEKDIVPFIESLNMRIRDIEKIMDKVQTCHELAKTDVSDPTLLLFEIITSFLCYECKNIGTELEFNIIEDVEGWMIFAPVSIESEATERIFEEFSTIGIDNTFYNGLSAGSFVINNNTYGKLIGCLVKAIKVDAKIVDIHKALEPALITACCNYWMCYRLSD